MPLHGQYEIKSLTDDGAWCWFSDPRAIQLEDGKIVTGWVKKDGTVEVASLDAKLDQVSSEVLFPQMQVDDHNNPAFCLLSDDRIFTTYTWHSSRKGVVYHVSDRPGDIHSNHTAHVIRPGIKNLLADFPRETFTYANPVLLSSEENMLYVFGRWIGYKPNMIKSRDGGLSWEEPQVVISASPFDPNNRPYVKYASNNKDRIDLIFTDGHPRIEPLNGIYHCYYQRDTFWKSDGTVICSVSELPFKPEEASIVYQPDSSSGRAWLADIMLDADDLPYVLYTRHPHETDHRYHYAYFNKEDLKWVDREICKAGKWFPQTLPGQQEREQHYHGNLTIHPSQPEVVYLSRQVDGVFEIEKRTTPDQGLSWEVTPITSGSQFDNVRPYVPRYSRNDQPQVVLWMQNKKYVHYTDYDSQILYWVDE